MSDEIKQLIVEKLGAPTPDHLDMLPGDHALNPHWPRETLDMETSENLRDAAVLVPLIDRRDGLTVLLTKRASDLPSHAGQVSFPGGRIDATDESPVHAALRETHEEVGIEAAFISVIGTLDLYQTVTGYAVQPVVGLVNEGFELRPHAGEVDEVFEVPFEFLMDRSNHRRHETEWKGQRRSYYSMPYGDYFIWGATAAMLINLQKRLYG